MLKLLSYKKLNREPPHCGIYWCNSSAGGQPTFHSSFHEEVFLRTSRLQTPGRWIIVVSGAPSSEVLKEEVERLRRDLKIKQVDSGLPELEDDRGDEFESVKNPSYLKNLTLFVLLGMITFWILNSPADLLRIDSPKDQFHTNLSAHLAMINH